MDRTPPPTSAIAVSRPRPSRTTPLLLLLALAPLVLAAPRCVRTGVALVRVAEGLDTPVLVTAPARDARLFVLEETGRVRILRNGTVLARPFLDLSSQVSGPDARMVGLAFPPDYAQSGLFYVSYVRSDGAFVVERYRVDPADPDVAATGSPGQILGLFPRDPLRVGGQIGFGPDGFFWIALGDDGDPTLAQNLASLYGKLLRIDLRPGFPRVPSDNPFRGRFGVRGEIWALGLRDPARFFHDPLSGLLVLGDHGASLEEMNLEFVPAGGGNDYGTSALPLFTLPHTQPGCPELVVGATYYGSVFDAWGQHFYADACSGRILGFRAARRRNGALVVAEHRDWTDDLRPDRGRLDEIAGIGLDAAGELYVVDRADGELFQLVTQAAADSAPTPL